MSHVCSVDIEIRDLDALDAACKRLGLELVRGQQTFRWYGKHVGDYPLPAGFSAEDLGTCDHAIRVPGNHQAYEVGIVKRRDGRPGFQCLWDFWAGGHGLQAKVGENCSMLRQAYATVVAVRQAQRSGFRVQEHKQADGSVRLVCSK